jgi:protein-disulfide isomerase
MPKKEPTSWGIWAGAAVLIAAALGLVIFLGGQKPAGTGLTIPATVAADDHVQGDPSAKVVLIEYGDFQCPACAAFDPLVQQITTDFGSKIAYVYRYFPLRSIHPNADVSAQAAEAAGKQGKFWEMAHMLFAKQKDWQDKPDAAAKEIFTGYARELGLDAGKFQADLDSSETKARINRDVASGTAANLPGTPSFFLNGNQIVPQSADEFRAMVQAAVDQAGQ